MALPAASLPVEWLRSPGIHLAAGFRSSEIQHRSVDYRQPQGHAHRAHHFSPAGVGSRDLHFATRTPASPGSRQADHRITGWHSLGRPRFLRLDRDGHVHSESNRVTFPFECPVRRLGSGPGGHSGGFFDRRGCSHERAAQLCSSRAGVGRFPLEIGLASGAAGGFARCLCGDPARFWPGGRRNHGRPHGQRQCQHRLLEYLRFNPDHHRHYRRRTGRSSFRQPALSNPLPHRRASLCRHFRDQPTGGDCGARLESKNGGTQVSGETSLPQAAVGKKFRSARFDWTSFLGSACTGLAVLLIFLILAVILGNIIINGLSSVSWRFITTGTATDMFDVNKAGILPMIFGTSARVILMTLFVLPAGVLTAIYLTEYARMNSPFTRLIRGAVNNLAGVPSIVFGLFGAGFFVRFVGRGLDQALHPSSASVIWAQPGLLWASATLAVMTLPVVIVATEEALRAIPQGLREASLALGATKLETIVKIVLPQATPGIMTGAILAISRAAGEVAPILFTGAAYYMADLPKSLHDQFMDLGYHVFILSTQSPNVDKTRPLLYATVLVLLCLTFLLNIVAIFVRANMRRKMRMLQ